MHIAEGILPPAQCVAWFAVSAPFVVQGARAVSRESRAGPDRRLLLAAAGAFTLVLSAIKLPSVTGSSSHPTGTGLGTVLFRPPVMAFLGTVVLLFQALLLAHGGLTTLGANVFSAAIAGPWAGYAAFVAVRARGGPLLLGVFLAMALADLTTYVVTSVQLALAFPDVVGGFGAALVKFLGIFALTQLPLALAEGFLGVLVVRMLSTLGVVDLSGRGSTVLVTDAPVAPGPGDSRHA